MDWKSFISQYDLPYETPPTSWQDGLVMATAVWAQSIMRRTLFVFLLIRLM